jgi:hypothetical protein
MSRSCIVALLVLVAAGAYSAYQGRSKGPSLHTPAGQPAYGFAVALMADSTSAPVGKPLWVTLELRNVSGTLQYASTFARGDGIKANTTFGLDAISGPLIGKPVPAATSMFLKFDLTHADVNAALVIRRRAQLGALRMPDAGAEPVTQHDAA